MAPHAIDCPHGFHSLCGSERKRSISIVDEALNWAGIALTVLYVGAAAKMIDEKTVQVGISIHDGVYSVDFCVHTLHISPGESIADALKADAVETINKYSKEHHAKFVGCGLAESLISLCRDMPSFLWSELDIVVMRFKVKTEFPKFECSDGIEGNSTETIPIDVDEQADSAVRKCIMNFGPGNNPALSIGFRNRVEPDIGGRIELVTMLESYQKTVREGTWNSLLKYANELKKNKTKVAFFSATPQGGGVALMRHALIRFYRLLGVNVQWYIPKPNPKVFRITKTNHNILQGVADPFERLTEERQQMMNEWISYNANRYWLGEGGPLAKGGVDVVIIDDPQMPGLIPLIKEHRPEVKVIYRSHIELRSDLIGVEGSPQAEVWKFLWDRIKFADVFISHPVDKFVPAEVPMSMVGMMPACTDWLDGLNKDLRDWDLRYYHHSLKNSCSDIGMNMLHYPAREYITQVARFDPSKGIPDVIESYRKFREMLEEKVPGMVTPQLMICGHGAIDDPDASIIYDLTLKQLDEPRYDEIREDVVVMRIGPSDQILNAILSCAKLVVQLSTREGFEVKVSEAIHKGKPIVATRAGGIPLQVQHGKNGYLVEVGDTTAVAIYLYNLYTDRGLYKRLSEFAKVSVSDEVSTVGNAACWLYLAAKLAKGEEMKPNAKWITDMYRKDAEQPYAKGEPRLPRLDIHLKGDYLKNVVTAD